MSAVPHLVQIQRERMSRLPQSLSRPALLAAIEDNNSALWRHFARLPGAELHEDRKSMWLITGLTDLPLNGVLRARLSPRDIDREINEMLAPFLSRNLPMMWWVGSSTRPRDLGVYLEAHGLTHSEELPAMAADLAALNSDMPVPPGLAVKRVADDAALESYFQAWTTGFEESQPVAQAFFYVHSSLGFGDDAPLRHYIGWLEGIPVATASLLLGKEVAEVFSLATVPSARRRGIGSAMMLAALRDARARGYGVGTLHSTEMGLDLYRRLGFRECGRANVYTLSG